MSTGCIRDEQELMLLVSHPHPDNDHGGGPGPVEDWNLPIDSEAYSTLVDSGSEDDEDGGEDARFEVDAYQSVAVRTAGGWTLERVTQTGTVDALRLLGSGRHGALVSYGGSAWFMAVRAGEGGVWEALQYEGAPAGLVGTQACFSGEEVVLAGSRGFGLDSPAEVGVLVREGGVMRWAQSLGALPGRVLALDSCLGADGRRVLYAGGQGLWMHGEGGWREVHSFVSGEVSFVRCFPSGAVVAGTTRGDVILGTAEGCRVVARVGRIHSAERWGGEFYVADAEGVYRVDASGFERRAVPKESSVARNVPDVGRLIAGADRLWLAGSHVLASSADGMRWTTHPVR
ncbi:hypothetical protein LXT21_30345 [Myxococcus sp. K38C18041901]|uniref:hypothetical protein n=1 Tax=Myxococcus guangdongensis TaxID=2906760 RepID=UPI0020A794F8|nr:hypothetical protein [Myxococcus guangdongensis]MCP3063084.1 hypothetical protein [Myxococcus guangdongensis]